MKKFKNVLFLVTLLCLWSAKSYSEEPEVTFNWVVPSVSIAPGGTATVDVQATGAEFSVVEMTIKLPEGITYVADSWKLGSRVTKSDYDFTFDYDADVNSIHIAGVDDDANVISGTEGTVFSFDIKADESLELGTSLTLAITESLWCNYDYSAYGETPDMNVTIKVEEAAKTVSITLDHEYITYCSDKTLDFDAVDGLSALYVKEVTSTEAILTGVGTVAAGQGFILQGTKGTTYEVPVVEEGADLEGNLLVGVLIPTKIAAGSYILMDGEFIPCTEGTLPAGKAYLPKSTSDAKIITLAFGESTGINEIQKAETDGAIYNLNGMRVSKTQKGVYIMNGRKVIVK